jgi:hypothetical protein
MATETQAVGSGAGSTFPVTNDVLNTAYDPAIGPAVMAMQQFSGGYTGPTTLTNVIAQSITDDAATSSLTATAGTVFATLMNLTKGAVINKISLINAVTATSTPTNQWAGIASVATTSKVLAVTADTTTAVVAADTVQSFAFATPYTVPTSGQYWVFFCIAGTTGPTVAAAVTTGTHGRGNVSPFLCGPCATGQTTVLAVASTFTTPTAASANPLIYLN